MEDTELKILQAAREEFIETGLKGARMQAIANRAGVNKALLHYYFRSKEKLYEAALREPVETLWGTVEAQMKQIGTAPDLKTLIRFLVISYIKTMSSNPLFLKIVMREILDGGKNVPQLAQNIVSRFGAIPANLFDLVKKEAKKGTIRNVEPLDVILNILGMCIITFAMQPVVKGISAQFGIGIEFDEKFYQRRIDSIIEMAYSGIFVKDKK